MMPSPTTQVALYKGLTACGCTLTAAIPPVFAVIEPMNWADFQARQAYLMISFFSAVVAIAIFRPKDWIEGFGRILAAVVCSFAFTEPVAQKIRPYLSDIKLQDGAPMVAALPAAFFIGISAWFVSAFIVSIFRNPKRIARFVDWWKEKTWVKFNAIFAEDDDFSSKGEIDFVAMLANAKTRDKVAEILQLFPPNVSVSALAPDTSKKGASQSQSGSGVTLTPEKSPEKTVTSLLIMSEESKTKTNG